MVVAFDLGPRLPGRGSRHDARRLSLGLSSGRGKLARCGSRPGGDRPQPRSEFDSTFVRITLAQARRAILGGCLLVALVILAEYGAFEILGYQTFTTEIFTEFTVGLDTTAACALSLVLVALSLLVARGRGRVARGGKVSRSGPGVQRVVARRRLGRAKLPVLLAYGLLVLAALGVPIGSSIYWIFEGGAHSLNGVSLGAATLYTAGYSAAAALVATAMALPVALLVVRHPSHPNLMLEKSTFLVLATPGLVVALALSYFSEHRLNGFGYQSAPLLVLAYALLFFPLALVCVRASVAQSPDCPGGGCRLTRGRPRSALCAG